MKELQIREMYVGGETVYVMDSKEVAIAVGKEHKNLLRDIKGYVDILDKAHGSNLSSENFFIQDSYLNSRNQVQPCYQLTRKGCDMVANKMTGEKGVLFTAEYVTKFEEMEKRERSQQRKLSPVEMLELQFKFSKEIEHKVIEVSADLREFKGDIPLFNIETDELQKSLKKKAVEVLGGYKSAAYKNKSISTKVFSDIQREIKRNFGINSYKAIKRKHIDLAYEIIEKYRVPLYLQEEIELANSQTELSVV